MKISQYADDSNFFLKNEESVKNTLNFFKTLNKATGTTINLEKTTILPINTDQTEQIQKTNPKITMKEQFETIKILGIYYDESLKNASSINWDNTLEKMERSVTLHGQLPMVCVCGVSAVLKKKVVSSLQNAPETPYSIGSNNFFLRHLELLLTIS